MEGFPEKIIDGVLQFTNPTHGSVFGSASVDDAAAVEAKIEKLRNAQQSWARRPLEERISVIRNIRHRFARAGEEIVSVLTEEIGRPETESWFSEVVPNIELFDYWLKNVGKYIKPEKLKLSPINYPGKQGWIEWIPRGVLGLITPWNFPVAIPLRSLIPGLLAGNAVLWKPSEWSTAVAQPVFDMFAAELPDDVLQMAVGAGETGAAVVETADMIIFTGSVATGRRIEVRCAERGISCASELGGKDAAYVAADANLDRAAAGLAWGAMMNCGQNCASVERIYVEQKVYEAFVAKLEIELNGLRGQVGPLVNPLQAKKVAGQVTDAIAAGASAAVGGEGEGLFIEPTLLLNAREDMEVIREETFGPVVPVMPVADCNEAIVRINASSYALTTSIWTTDYAWARSIKDQLISGVVTVNNHGFTAAIPGAPWTGAKDSGRGVTNSHIALHEMMRPRFYLEDRNKAVRELWWYPYTQNAVDLAKTLVQTMLPGGNKIAMFVRLLNLMRKRWQS